MSENEQHRVAALSRCTDSQWIHSRERARMNQHSPLGVLRNGSLKVSGAMGTLKMVWPTQHFKPLSPWSSHRSRRDEVGVTWGKVGWNGVNTGRGQGDRLRGQAEGCRRLPKLPESPELPKLKGQKISPRMNTDDIDLNQGGIGATPSCQKS